MKKLLVLIVAIATSSLGTAQEAEFVQNEVLVQLQNNTTPVLLAQQSPEVAIATSRLISRPMNIWLLQLEPSAMTEQMAIAELYRNNLVLVAQKNHKVSSRATEPDDPFFGDQWQYKQASDGDIDADEAWDITTGGITMNGDVIVAAALDDGIDLNHQDFEDNLWTNEAEIPDNGIDDDGNGYTDDYLGWSIVTNSDNISGGGHGTPVAGIIGAKGNNGVGVSGVNWDVKVMVIKNNFNTNEAQVIEAYSYALEARMLYNSSNGAEGAFVVSTNASWGVDFGDPADAPLWCALYDTLGENGILSCGATINGNFNVDNVGDLPTACPSEYLITVTNMDISDMKVTNAGYGAETIDLGAHGAGAYTTSNGNGYGGFGGTSGATPHVTGAIALLYSAPCQEFADLAISNPSQAAKDVRDYIFAGVDPNPSLEGITTTGGRLNLNNSLQGLMGDCDVLATNDFLQQNNPFVLYPNPANSVFTIQHSENTALAQVSILTMDGKLIEQTKNPSNLINIENLAAGMYMVRVSFIGDATVYNQLLLKE
ncbi:S8 family peptidase [Marinirhabdus gelatinilytica]|uniref:Putative secreted protein (Por secretion system target) n=1 Tax=Marinirhabdus gelatinilytica TaxID=1703343 RepID=A0A370QAD5_9FLAO|nr:S8 family peptidase [Marinirhabdus gelatinilytica]RDK85326.1 putative secreted protein (Por secretion system target) [Marinirhabdus gelatinilytica]